MVRQLRDTSDEGIPLSFSRTTARYAPRKRKTSAWAGWFKTTGILLGVMVAGGLGYILFIQDRSSLAIGVIDDQEINQGDKVRMRIPLDLNGYEPEQLTYSLRGPEGATIDRKTGEFSWSTEGQDAGTYQMTVKVVAVGAQARSDQRTFTIRIRAREKPKEVAARPVEAPAARGPDNPFEAPGNVVPKGKIDELVFAKLKELKIQPANLCSDAVFLHRVYLDVIGTLPTAQEGKDFLADKNPHKRAVLIDRLLERPEYADYWAMKWSDLLRVKAEFPINLWPNAAQAYHRWLRTSMRENMPFDRFVRELLTASGSNFRTPQVNFYRALQSKTPPAIAQAVALAFMGVRADKWPKEQLAGMAVFFSKIGYKPTGEWKEEIVVFDPRKVPGPPPKPGPPPDVNAKPKPKPKPAPAGPAVAPTFPDGMVTKIPPDKDPREVFADWLIRPENPWFCRHIVNRAWYWLLGRGIVHEPDDIRPDNPAQNPELLNYLGSELVAAHYDLKHIFRLILNSSTYQLSCIPRSKDPRVAANFAVYPLHRLEAEVVIDAVCQITGTTESYTSIIPEPYSFIPDIHRTITLPDGSITSAFLETFGRPARDTGLESERNNKVTAGQRLHLLNSSHILNKIRKGPKMEELFQSTSDARQVAEMLYLGILGRLPTEEEWDIVQGYCGSRFGGQNIAWALINSEEFLFRH